MKTIFDSCEPRTEVLKGELREEIFAARLKDVIEGKADPVYQEPATSTEGLKLLLDEVLGRLTGVKAANNAIIRLETAFGGGKTHNLIGLYHAANGYASGPSFVDAALIPTHGTVRVVGVVGSDLPATRWSRSRGCDYIYSVGRTGLPTGWCSRVCPRCGQ
jgi:hypothetical protein